MRSAGDFEAMPKKEALILTRELEKLERNLGGIRDMARLPDAVFIIDIKKEHIAVSEANKMGIPIVAVVDTNCDPDLVQYPIPGNDDAIRSGTLMCRVIQEAVEEGQFVASRRGTGGPAAGGPPIYAFEPGSGFEPARVRSRPRPPPRPQRASRGPRGPVWPRPSPLKFSLAGDDPAGRSTRRHRPPPLHQRCRPPPPHPKCGADKRRGPGRSRPHGAGPIGAGPVGAGPIGAGPVGTSPIGAGPRRPARARRRGPSPARGGHPHPLRPKQPHPG